MGKNKKKGILIISCLFVILLSIFLYPRKDDSKSIIKKSYAFNIKNNGETSYTSVDTIPSDLTNYHIDEEKTICENGGKVSIVGNKLAYQTLGSDRCSVYLYYEKLPDIKINVTNPSYLLGGYTKSITNCDGITGGTWDYKINGIIIDNISKTNSSCNITFTPKTPTTAELLSTVVNNKATRNQNGKRYQGKNPNNYIWFNDELWRIIGNIPVCLTSGCASTENRVKIIRNDSIGGISFNQTNYSSSSPLTWMGSNIQNLLNTCYLGKKSSCDSYCYCSDSSKGTCDYSSDGIDTTDFYGKMVEDVYFNVGAGDSTYKTAANYYTQEIATHTTSTSKIGLMHASDWGYAIEGFTGIIGNDGLSSSSISHSSDKNWLMSNGYEWTMSAYSSSKPLGVSLGGHLADFYALAGYSIRPVLYLKSNVYVTGGTGSKVDPYRIGI